MNRKRIWIIVSIFFVIVISVLAINQWSPSITSAETLTEQEARESVLKRYAGEIVSIDLLEDRYEVELKLETGLYELHVDARTGEVLSLVHTESYTSEPDLEEGDSDIESAKELDRSEIETIEPPPTRLLSKADAVRIALEYTSGEVDDVDFKEMNGTGFYLVEIERDDDREVYIQIHAITGEIMSVSWDDDDAWEDL